MDGQDRGPRHMVNTAVVNTEGSQRGRILDLDGHVMFGPDVFADLLGPEHAGPITQWLAPMFAGMTPELRASARERGLDDVGAVRGFVALGADDPIDRLLALDLLGIDRQLILPPVAWPTLDTLGESALASRRRYNDWIRNWCSESARLVGVAQLALHDPDETFNEAQAIVASGFRAVEVPFAAPPGARSPGDPAWDPMWELFEANGVAVVLHLGGAGAGTAVPAARSFLDRGWTSISHLQTDLFPECMKTLSENANAGPVSLATLHLPAEVFLSSLILGGALQRHPGLRVVVLEMGAQWVSSWVERLDGVAGTYSMFGLPRLKDSPSTCIKRQVRITPFERNNVAEWIERDGLGQVYAFASDFPHAEGGHDPIGRLSRTLAPLGDVAAERFFVDNASSILADAPVGAAQ